MIQLYLLFSFCLQVAVQSVGELTQTISKMHNRISSNTLAPKITNSPNHLI